MKEQLKKIIYLFGIWYQVLKLKEIYMKVFISSNNSKERYIKKQFRKSTGKEIDFNKEPKTFNEKIQFRKIYDNNPLYSICADKYRVREYVKEKIGEEYLIPLLLVTDKLTEEQWDKLPNQFVAKANHNSGPVQIVKDKTIVNKKEIINELNNQLKLDYGILSLEKYYSDIPKKIIIEKYLEHKSDTLEDFKFHVFNNGNIFVEHILHRTLDGNIYENFYTKDWKKLNIAIGARVYEENILKPKNLDKMLEIAKRLAEDFDYVRVDLYDNNGSIFFGELTFCGDSGFGKFTKQDWDYKFGSYWKQKKLK